MHGHNALSAHVHPPQGLSRCSNMKARMSAQHLKTVRQPVTLLVEMVIWFQTVAIVSSSAALSHCISQIHSWTRTQCRAKCLPLRCLFCSTLNLCHRLPYLTPCEPPGVIAARLLSAPDVSSSCSEALDTLRYAGAHGLPPLCNLRCCAASSP